ncbi:MAG: diaminopimelate epimerase [Oscillospiraceae bacterium]|nr:diaminopimelate epimerase [Oscillospiraceae bacterium]
MYYTKMHGAGNSFILTENLRGELQGEDLSILALRLCSPETGPGADGMIVVVPAEAPADFGMLFYNSDGSLGEMCGNGARCIARYGAEHGLAPDPENIRVQTTAGLVSGRRITQEQYEVRLNDPSVIRLVCDAETDSGSVRCSYVELGSPGIPHAVVLSEETVFQDPDLLRERARALRHSPTFPKGANVTFVSPLSENRVRAITFERGVEDFTLACGTGCGAVAVSLILQGVVPGNCLEIEMPGGLLRVRLRRDGDTVRDILLTGPTAVVETGEYAL